jgi:o-succinylbenzoate synthase
VRVVASSLTSFHALPRAPGDAALPERQRQRQRRGVWLSLTDSEGNEGFGEAAPLPGYSPDDLASSERALEAVHERLDPLQGPSAVAAVTAALAPLDLSAVPAARFALETALLDLWSKRRGLSIAESLGGPRPYSQVRVNALLSAPEAPGELVLRAGFLVGRGFRTLKVKLRATDDTGFKAELSALSHLRAELPPTIELRLDPNGAYRLPGARERLRKLAPLRPAYVEQPVPPSELLRLGPCAVPWAADESLQDPAAVDRFLDAKGCAAFVLKPAVLGLLRAFDIARRAQERGLGVVVTHLFDGPIGHAAACELALALHRAPLACGLDRSFDTPATPAFSPRFEVPHLAREGFVIAPGHAGLGVSLPTPEP